MVYVSITGIRLHSIWHMPRFWWFTIPAMRQARAAKGNLLTQAGRIDGVFHTLSVWTDKAAMQAYLGSGAHYRAMRALPRIGAGRTLGFTAEAAPHWREAHARWLAESRPVG